MHDFLSELLTIAHGLATSAPVFCLILALPVKQFLLLVPKIRPLRCVPKIVKLFAPLGIVVPGLDSQNKVVKYDAAPDPHDRPDVFPMSVDLNTELEQGLKPAFQQANCVFDANTDLQARALNR